MAESGSLPSFAAQSTNGRNAKNRPFAAPVCDVSVADQAVIRCGAALEMHVERLIGEQCLVRPLRQNLSIGADQHPYGVALFHTLS